MASANHTSRPRPRTRYTFTGRVPQTAFRRVTKLVRGHNTAVPGPHASVDAILLLLLENEHRQAGARRSRPGAAGVWLHGSGVWSPRFLTVGC